MTDLELLRGIRELIGVPERWTQNTAARDSKGRTVQADSCDAVCFCLFGAARRLFPDTLPGPLMGGLDAALGLAPVRVGKHGAVHFNDTHTHTEVVALLDRRIAELETSSA